MAGLNETFATEALGVLLEQRSIRSNFLRHLQDRYGQQGAEIDLLRTSHFASQVVDREFGRPDLVGFDDQGQPILVIEAKFDFTLGSDQAVRYLQWQIKNQVDAPPALVLLMPRQRVGEGVELGLIATEHLNLDKSVVLAVSWEEMLDVVDAAAADLGTGYRSYLADAAQLRDLVEHLCHSGLKELTGPLTFEHWDENFDALCSLVDAASKRINEIRGTEWTRPQREQPDSSGFGPFHYVRETEDINYALGPHKTFASHGLGPLWLRFHKDTAGRDRRIVHAVRSRLVSNGDWRLRDDEGHIWVPITVEQPWGETSVDLVVDQVLDVLHVGLPRS